MLLKVNKLFLGLVGIMLYAFLMQSCAAKRITKPSQVVTGGETLKDTEAANKPIPVDTIILTNKTKVVSPPPISSKSDYGSKYFNAKTHQVALIVPLDANTNVLNANQNLRFIQYYGGMKLAAKQLEEEGVHLNINVFDNATFSINDLKMKYDLIIGPYASAGDESSKRMLNEVINYGKLNATTVVSPWYSSSKATENNPYFIQLKPNIREYFATVVNHVGNNFKPEDVVLLGRPNSVDGKWFEYFQSLGEGIYKRANPFTTIQVLDSDINTSTSYKEAMDKGKRVFIIPNYSFSDEQYIQKVLNKLANDKNGKEIYVYAMPVTIDSDKIGYNLYTSLNMRIATPEYVDRDNPSCQQFIKQYFELWKTIPASDAFEGRDVMLYLGRGLANYGGANMAKKLKSDDDAYLQATYNIQPVYEDGSDNFSNVSYYENKHLYILGFLGGKFRKM